MCSFHTSISNHLIDIEMQRCILTGHFVQTYVFSFETADWKDSKWPRICFTWKKLIKAWWRGKFQVYFFSASWFYSLSEALVVIRLSITLAKKTKVLQMLSNNVADSMVSFCFTLELIITPWKVDLSHLNIFSRNYCKSNPQRNSYNTPAVLSWLWK